MTFFDFSYSAIVREKVVPLKTEKVFYFFKMVCVSVFVHRNWKKKKLKNLKFRLAASTDYNYNVSVKIGEQIFTARRTVSLYGIIFV